MAEVKDENTSAGIGVADWENLEAPRAEVKEQEFERFGLRWRDPYAWLRERENSAVRAHLEAENRYAEAWLSQSRELEGEIYREMVGRMQEDDTTVPVRRAGFFYYERTVKGSQYPLICRTRGEEGAEEVLLDVNQLAEGKGLSPRRIFFGYAMRNALLPQVTSLAIALGTAASGSVLVEVAFNYPGIGYLLFNALKSSDYFLIQGVAGS